MKNLYLIILFILFFNINAHSAFINITEDYKKKSNCKLDKIILKNEIYNNKNLLILHKIQSGKRTLCVIDCQVISTKNLFECQII